jgi:hypothetical protein
MCRAAAISRLMGVRFLFGVLIAVAMAFAPLAMPIGEAMAAQPSHHDAMAGKTKGDHCSGEPKQEHSDKDQQSCCIAGCFALASLNAHRAVDLVRRISVERPAREQFKRGLPAEIATPPPRAS